MQVHIPYMEHLGHGTKTTCLCTKVQLPHGNATWPKWLFPENDPPFVGPLLPFATQMTRPTPMNSWVKLLNYLVSRYSDFRYLDSIDPFFLVKHEQTKLTLSFAKSSRVPDIDLLKSHRGHLFGWGTLGMEYPQSFGVGLFFSKHVCPEVSLHL